jgi:hypothetical protein
MFLLFSFQLAEMVLHLLICLLELTLGVGLFHSSDKLAEMTCLVQDALDVSQAEVVVDLVAQLSFSKFKHLNYFQRKAI